MNREYENVHLCDKKENSRAFFDSVAPKYYKLCQNWLAQKPPPLERGKDDWGVVVVFEEWKRARGDLRE